VIRFCPNCRTERPLTEFYCEGTRDGVTCHWDLSGVEFSEPGAGTRPTEASPSPAAGSVCPNGHAVGQGDLLCPVCEVPVGDPAPVAPPSPAPEPVSDTDPTVIDGWQVSTRLSQSSPVREKFVAVRQIDGRQAVLTLYAQGSEPDPSIYDVIRKLPRDHVPEIFATGRWQDRAFEVVEELTGGNLSALVLSPHDLGTVRQVVEQLGRALNAFSDCGLRHRDLHPGAVLIRSSDPLGLVITDFGSARLSEFDLDIVSPPHTTRYMAPEEIAGGVAAASDWWSLGMLLLERLTNGACFEGVNEQAFLIHVVTNGVPIPRDLDPPLYLLLRGLLARDRRKRWQWNEVRAWLAGEQVEAPTEESGAPSEPSSGASISLAGRVYRTAASFALAAAEAANWDEARDNLLRGAVASWAHEADFDPILQSGLRQIGRALELSEDLRLSMALKILNAAMPLIVRGNILTPGWLLDHPQEGYELITGPAPDFLRKLDTEDWLSRLKTRADATRLRARQFDIELNEEELRIHLLSTSVPRLAAMWEERRKLLPDTEHPGLASLIDRRQTGEEDLILLLSASIGQFRSATEVVQEADREATRAGIGTFVSSDAEAWLARQRRDIYRAVDERIENFSRCGIAPVDDWADQFRLDRRLTLSRALALLSVPEGSWKELTRQGYVSTILGFFSKKITGGVLRGPLARMTIGKSAARVDLTELGTERVPAATILAQLLSRLPSDVNIDPAAFADGALERRLRSLHSRSLLYRRDTGIDGLYLGFPFLLMRDLRGNTRTRIAPVLLWPVRITPEVGNRGHVTLGFGRDHGGDRDPDQVILNPAFEGLMGFEGTARWQEAAAELLTRAMISVADALDAFGTIAASRGNTLVPLPGRDIQVPPLRPELAPSAVLFHLAFMGQAVVKDLDHLRQRPPEGTALETALRLAGVTPEKRPSVRPRETDKYFTADSDPSQEQAVMEARSAPGLVVEGPPGTGKSQTIVNMVADSIGRGKSLLVICQKQAALDVVRKRLEREKLGERIVMVTDINRDREPVVRAIREQVQAVHMRPTGGAPAWKRERERVAARIEALEGELDRHQDALHRADEHTGLTYRTLLGELIALSTGRPSPLSLPGLRSRLSKLQPSEVAMIEESCAPLTRFWLPAKFEDSALSVLKTFSPDQGSLDIFITTFKDFVDAEASRDITNTETADAFRIDNPGPLRSWLSEHEARFRSLSEQDCALLAQWLPLFRPFGGATRGASILADLPDARASLVALDASAHGLPASTKLRALPDVEFGQAASLAISATKSAVGWRRFGRWVGRKKLRKLMFRMGLPKDGTGMVNFASAVRLEGILRPLRARVEAASRPMFGKVPDADVSPAQLAGLAKNLHTLLAKILQLVDAIDECPESIELERAAEAGAHKMIAAFLDRAKHSLRRFDVRIASFAALDALTSYFVETWLGARRNAVENERSNAAAIRTIVDAVPMLGPYQEFRIRAPRLGENELAVFRVFRSKEKELEKLDPVDLDTCVRSTIGTEARLSWKLRLEATTPEVLLGTDMLEKKVDALAKADAAIRVCNRDLLTDDIDQARMGSDREWDDITRLSGPRALRLREFIDKAITLGLMSLRPVWLMTPDVASRVLLPKAGMFDTVIYDEASQMPVEYSLPTLFRSKVVVVSGDDKQMPPTSFFSSKVENDEAGMFDGEEPDDDAPDEERDAYTETWNRREIKDCPDLLHLARVVLPTRTLQVHYRSKYRELIAFSNASFYGNRLSVPVRHPDDVVRKVKPIEVIRSDGVYKDQSNLKEAADVVRYLVEMWRKPSPPSIGVVTFNRKQADIIEEAIEDMAENDRDFRDVLMRERERTQDGEDMGFFVKNVENVQGDERDVVVFSTTFGRNAEGAFRRYFGVLGQVGGERRLNVAVTRARMKVVLMTSMPVELISGMHSHRGPPARPRDYLQAYLEYARTVSDGSAHSTRALLGRLGMDHGSERSTGSVERDGFSNAVENFLREQGWGPADANDGGAFGFDFAIEDPRTGLYAIGIECDAPRHRILETARAREVWRPSVLRHAIPHVHRVSSYGWMHGGDAERARLRSAVERALSGEGRTE
jgi:primosomal replication protein N''